MKTSQRSLLLGVILVTLPSVGWSTTYYVDNCVVVGKDSNNGTSPSTPWLTMNKVNTTTGFQPGDQILFRRTCVWRDHWLGPDVSGTAGNPITFGAYGTGANPQINAASVVSSWTNASGNIWQATVTVQPSEVARNKARAQPVASQGGLVRNYQWYWASSVLYVYSSTNPNSDGSLWESADLNQCIYIANGSHLVFSNFDLYYSNGTGDPNILIRPTSNITDIAFNNLNLYLAYSRGIYVSNASAAVSNVIFNNVNVRHCCAQSVNGVQIDLPTTTSNPTTNLTWTGGSIVYSGNDSNLGPPIASTALSLDNCTNCTVTNLQIHHSGSSAVNVENGSTGITLTGGSWHDDGRASSGDRNEFEVGSNGNGSSNITVSNVSMYNDGGDTVELSATNTHRVGSNVTVKYCQIANGAGAGIHVDSGFAGVTFAYNLIYGNAGWGYEPISNTYGTPQVSMYNNVFWGNGSSSHPANIYVNAAGGTTFKNNIVGQANGASTGSGSEVLVSSGSYFAASDYNDWYHAAGGNFMSYRGTAYNFAGWKAATGQDAHSLSVDPQFVSSSPSGPNDFKLRPTSPLIGAGINLGTAYEYGLDTQSANFPYATFNQNLSSQGWDIGAFVFRQSFLLVVR
jgi:hypothetical protein